MDFDFDGVLCDAGLYSDDSGWDVGVSVGILLILVWIVVILVGMCFAWVWIL